MKRVLVAVLVALLLPVSALAADFALPGGLLLQLFSESLTPTAISAGACGQGTATLVSCSTTQTFTLAGLKTTDKVFVSAPVGSGWPAGEVCPAIGADVSAVNTLRVRFAVQTTAACTPASGTYQIFAIGTR